MIRYQVIAFVRQPGTCRLHAPGLVAEVVAAGVEDAWGLLRHRIRDGDDFAAFVEPLTVRTDGPAALVIIDPSHPIWRPQSCPTTPNTPTMAGGVM